jgi:hypothetical protein
MIRHGATPSDANPVLTNAVEALIFTLSIETIYLLDSGKFAGKFA